MHTLIDDCDWEYIFENFVNPPTNGDNPIHEPIKLDYPITRNDVTSVIAISNGQNDEDEWLGVFEVDVNCNTYFLMVRAWCDYTGWG